MRRSLFRLYLLALASLVLAQSCAYAQLPKENALPNAQTPVSTFQDIYTFCLDGYMTENCLDGADPWSGVIQAADGRLYGTASEGGSAGLGTVFSLTTSGGTANPTIYSFCTTEPCADGGAPFATVVQGGDGNLYGLTSGYNNGQYCPTGSPECGAAFKLSVSGSLTPLYEFCSLANCADGQYPILHSLIEGADGNYYGLTEQGGTGCESGGCGTFFKLTASGQLTTLYRFCTQAECADGSEPHSLLQGSDGNFYGTTFLGGNSTQCGGLGCGTIFKISPAGALTTLYAFSCIPGSCQDDAQATLYFEGSDGDFYGTTEYGGSNGNGSIFKIDTSGNLTTLYSVCSTCSDNLGNLWLASDGNIYGTESGADYSGEAFQLTPTGVFTSLAAYNYAMGQGPGGLTQASDGNFYGTFISGGAVDNGAVFKLSLTPALPAPVQMNLSALLVDPGQPVQITWKALNAFSATMQQCYAFINGSSTGAGTWTGLQSGSLVDGVYTGSATITPTQAGFYTYALTCGGVESNQVSLNATGAKLSTSPGFTTNSPVTLGGVATLTATPTTTQYVAPLTGSVTFSTGSTILGTVNLSSGTASLNITAQGIPLGTYPITATYSGDANYLSSTQTANLVVQGYATSTALNASTAQVTQGQSVTLSATVARTSVAGNPGGSVTFYYGTTVLGTATLKNGKASYTAATSGSIPPGVYAVTAKYPGDATDAPSASSVTDVTVLSATSTRLAVAPNPVPANHEVTLTATVKQSYGTSVPTGSVMFSVGSYNLGSATLDNTGTATVNASDVGIAAGTYPVTATYSGDSGDGSSTSAAVNVTVQ